MTIVILIHSRRRDSQGQETILEPFADKQTRNYDTECTNQQNGRLPFWEDSSCPPGCSSNLPFWEDRGLNVRYLRIFQIKHIFYKLDVKIVAANNEIRCIHSSCPPYLSATLVRCKLKNILFWLLAKEASGQSLKVNSIRNFYTMGSRVELNRFLNHMIT